MAINFGSSEVSDLQLGNTEVAKAYFGSSEVYTAVDDPTIFTPTAFWSFNMGRPIIRRDTGIPVRTSRPIPNYTVTDINFFWAGSDAPRISTGIAGSSARYLRRIELQRPSYAQTGGGHNTSVILAWVSGSQTDSLSVTTQWSMNSNWIAHPFMEFTVGSSNFRFGIPIPRGNYHPFRKSTWQFLTTIERTRYTNLWNAIAPFASTPSTTQSDKTEYTPRQDITFKLLY